MAFVAASILPFSSCSDFLDREPITKPEAGNFLTGAIQVENYINGLYMTLPSFSKFGWEFAVKKRIVTILLQKSMMPVCMDRITSLAELPIGRLVIRTCVK